jgi:DNA-binding beta-propeller fold protein YncE
MNARVLHPLLKLGGAMGAASVVALVLGCAASAAQRAESAPLALVADVPLPGAAARFDYQSLDSTTGRLYVSHMGAGRLVVFDTRTNRVIADLPGFPSVTGVLSVPALHRVYASVTGRHELAVVDDRTLATVAHVGGIRFPDGVAYDAGENAVFVSDESGRADVAIDAARDVVLATIPLGGEAGNTHFDPKAHRILVAVQTRNELAAIDPASRRVTQRFPVPCDHPHGFTLDTRRNVAFVSCEGDAKLLVVDLATMRATATFRVGDGPDVLALDTSNDRLYVASESGTVSVFAEDGASLRPLGSIQAPHAHSVAVDPTTHRVYLPLQSVNGRPVMRIMVPTER